MALYHSDDQIMLADTVRGFLNDKAPVAHLRSLRDSGDAQGFSTEIWKNFAELGLTGILVPEANGGLGLGHVELGIVLESIGRNLTPSPFLTTACGAACAIAAGNDQLRAQWLPCIASGELVASLAIDEAARHRPHHIALQAKRVGGAFRLSGAKRLVAYGHAADLLIVSARTSGAVDAAAGVSLFAIDPRRNGIVIETDRLVDSSLAARVKFEDAEVGADAVIGEIDEGAAILARLLAVVRTAAAAELVGLGDAAAQMTLDYLNQRRQFNQPISAFQALQHRAARLYSELEVARAAVLKAQQLLDCNDAGAEQAACVAKGVAGAASALAVQEGVQMHGGIGMTDEFDIGFFMKRQRVLDEMFGDRDYQADYLARLSGY